MLPKYAGENLGNLVFRMVVRVGGLSAIPYKAWESACELHRLAFLQILHLKKIKVTGFQAVKPSKLKHPFIFKSRREKKKEKSSKNDYVLSF